MSDLYPRALARHGIETAIPVDDDRHVVNDIIFGELVEGIFTDQARATYTQTIEKLRERGCDAVALACTEIPLLIDAVQSAGVSGQRGPPCRATCTTCPGRSTRLARLGGVD